MHVARHVIDRYGWLSPVKDFPAIDRAEVLAELRESYPNSSVEEVASWRKSIPVLQDLCSKLTVSLPQARDGSIVLEYTLPSREGRCDAVLLMDGMVSVLEIKGKAFASEEDIDQVRGYYHELRWNHAECVPPRRVHPLLVPLRSPSLSTKDDDVWIASPDRLPDLLTSLPMDLSSSLRGSAFTADDVARASPDIVKSARALFESSPLPRVRRSLADTRETIDCVLGVCRTAADARSRKLIFVSGVPGSGKTLVGLRLAHSADLDQLVVTRGVEKPSRPILYLSGNGPLVRVLRHSLRSVAGGRTFIGDVMDWIRSHVRPASFKVPDEHVIVFDEAQRAWDAERMAVKHGRRGLPDTGSEPETLMRIMERVPEWSVVVALIGQGQAIHVGEEVGIDLWARAARAVETSSWEVLGPAWIQDSYNWTGVRYQEVPALELKASRRQTFGSRYPELVDTLLEGGPPATSSHLASELRKEAGPSALDCEPFHICVTRSLQAARRHSQREISPRSELLCGLLVSSKDRLLEKNYGLKSNLFVAGGLNVVDWFSPATESSQSCTWLKTAATEFQVQGLELDLGIVCWGEDLIWDGARWNSERARPYQKGTTLKDAHALRLNSYRVLLTRGRRGSIVFVPPDPRMNLTFQRLVESGFLDITPSPALED